MLSKSLLIISVGHVGVEKKCDALLFINFVGSFAALWPIFVKYLLNWSTVTFWSVQQFPSDVTNALLTIDFLLLDFKTSFRVLHFFLQSFLNRSNLSLKYVFLESLII